MPSMILLPMSIVKFLPHSASSVSSGIATQANICIEQKGFHFSTVHTSQLVLLQKILYYYTLETAYKVAICPVGNLLYKQIYFINDLNLL